MSHPLHIDRRRLLALLAASAGAAGSSVAAGNLLGRPASAMTGSGGKARHPSVVVELFTSQGCSACPPADALLGELVRQPDILGISYNIDYWDYLGWRDTLARAEFTRRQRMYAKARGDDKVYTPQMVINGRWHVVGNDRRRVKAMIERARREGGCQQVAMTLRRKDKALMVDIAAAPDVLKQGGAAPEATLWLVTMRDAVSVKIRRGENRGRQITYHHVARSIVPAAMWHGTEQHLMLPLQEVMRGKADACAALLQLGSHGPIIAAAIM